MEKKKMNECNSEDELKLYLQDKAKNHNHYKIYTEEKRIESIFIDRCLYLSSVETWNDKTDYDMNNNNQFFYYGKCFSYLAEENVAMWMLYGGINGEGVMIDLNQGIITKSLKENDLFSLGYFEKENKFKQVLSLEKSNCDVSLIDVIYETKNNGYKRSDEYSNAFDFEIHEKGNIKKYPWSYECECRLLIGIPKSIIKKLKIDKKQLFIKFPLIFDEKKLEERVYSSPVKNKKYKRGKDSSLIGSIVWDLCKDCENKK